MKVEKNKIVSVTYELKVSENDEEKLLEVANDTNPLEFPFGVNLLLPDFEKALDGKVVGDNFDVRMSPENGYGYFNEQMIVDLPKNTFEVDGKVDPNVIKIGNQLPMKAVNGQIVNGIIKEVKEDKVTMDFNHPLAGKNLHFTGEIVKIREATEEELKQMNE